MIHPIVIDGDPVLRQRAAEVTAFDDELRTLVADMFDTLAAANGVGLAAPQIGVSRRVFVFDAPDEDTQRRGVMINPTMAIVQRPARFLAQGLGKRPPKSLTDVEGCLSFPGPDFDLKRHFAVRLTGFDEHGAPIEVDGEGWFARVLQHEFDHLDGFLYVDRLKGKDASEARALSKEFGWGVPGLTWMPGVDRDPFGHDDIDDDDFDEDNGAE
ncbi:peptide deformylase [Jonesia quinghaiensis]|uniref:peptide deformylase n=1 Tax=Jonesia quinghaiensis TaxID=262806 RepID=UPI00041440A3|nr:peptide deformylase [Jonesia quinghaiensis]